MNSSSRYYSGRGEDYAQVHGNSNNQSYQNENDYQYHRGTQNVSSQFQSVGTYHSVPQPSSRNQYATGIPQSTSQSYGQIPFKRPHDSGNNTPVDSFNRSGSLSSNNNTPTIASPALTQPQEFRLDRNESPFFYLTDLDKSTDNSVELDRIKHILRESDSLDKKIEEEKLRILKDELELSLLTTQCERDYLNVQLTQEKLDSLLMQG